MGIVNWFKNEVRVYRAGQIQKDKTEREQLENGLQSIETEKRIQKLNSRIAKNEERQKIASENNTKPIHKTKNVSINTTATVNNGINANIDMSKKA